MRSRRYDGRANIGSDAVAFSTTLVGEGADERERERGEGREGGGERERGRIPPAVPRRLATAMSCKIFN